jgi:microcin C transport system permease protein
LLISLLAAALGIAIVGLQGYLGGAADLAGQRFIEIWSALPFLYVVILLGSIYGRSFALLVAVVSLFGWIGLSYYMRGEFYRLKNLTYVRAARALGIPEWRIFWRHVFPNALTPVVTVLPFTLISGISALTALDFLGFGLQPPAPSWGELLRQGLDNLQAPWLATTGVAALFITLMLATFMGEGVRDAFDPKGGARLE